jgi:hypothetical protein
VGDPRVAQGRRWRGLWVHHEAEELRVHYRETIPEMTARHVIVDLLASHFTAPAKPMRRAQDFQTCHQLPARTDDPLVPVVMRGLSAHRPGLCFRTRTDRSA